MSSLPEVPILTEDQLKKKRKKKETTVIIFLMFCGFIMKLKGNDIKKLQVRLRKIYDGNLAAAVDQAKVKGYSNMGAMPGA